MSIQIFTYQTEETTSKSRRTSLFQKYNNQIENSILEYLRSSSNIKIRQFSTRFGWIYILIIF